MTIAQQQLDMIASNTVMVLTKMAEKREEWRGGIQKMVEQAQLHNDSTAVEFFQTVLTILDGTPASLPAEHPYASTIQQINQAVAQGGLQTIPPQELDVLVMNTITVLISMAENREQWRKTIQQSFENAQQNNQSPERELFQAMLAIVDGTPTNLPAEHAYVQAVQQINQAVADPTAMLNAMDAVKSLISTPSREAARQVVEQQQELVLRPEVQQILRSLVLQAQARGDRDQAQMYQSYIQLLHNIREHGIEATFASLEPVAPAAQWVQGTLQALNSSPAQKSAWIEQLTQARASADANEQHLLNALQQVLAGADPEQLTVAEEYQQLWGMFCFNISSGGVDHETITKVASNTVAVLTSTPEQRAEWLQGLRQIRQNDSPFEVFVQACIQLIETDGTQVTVELNSVYQLMWEQMLNHIKQYRQQ